LTAKASKVEHLLSLAVAVHSFLTCLYLGILQLHFRPDRSVDLKALAKHFRSLLGLFYKRVHGQVFAVNLVVIFIIELIWHCLKLLTQLSSKNIITRPWLCNALSHHTLADNTISELAQILSHKCFILLYLL